MFRIFFDIWAAGSDKRCKEREAYYARKTRIAKAKQAYRNARKGE
jgi:hypothetical protein